MYHIIIDMGRRKVRFDQRKNYERKKYRLSGKVPLKPLVVKPPISAFTSAPMPSIEHFRSRLFKSNLIPSGWSIASAEEGSQALCSAVVV